MTPSLICIHVFVGNMGKLGKNAVTWGFVFSEVGKPWGATEPFQQTRSSEHVFGVGKSHTHARTRYVSRAHVCRSARAHIRGRM